MIRSALGRILGGRFSGGRVGRGLVLLTSLSLALIMIAPGSVAAAEPARTSYDLDAVYEASLFLNWGTRRVIVRTTIEVRNTSGAPVDSLALNSVAVRLGSPHHLQAMVDGAAVQPRIVGQTIIVPLGASLAAGDSARVWVSFRARLRATNRGRDYYWSKSKGIAQMYRFIPWLSRTIPFGSQGHGEPFLTPNSRSVRVTLNSDRPLVWATSGKRVSRVARKFTFVARNVRDFNVTASPAYRTVSGLSNDGETRIFAHTRSIDGRRLVRLAKAELARYEAKTGVQYPHPTYRIAETGSGLPMESPGLIWIPGSRAAREHPFLVSHETAHQWFYGIVGNNQATNAFADEALADYFSRRAHLSLRASRCKTARLDRSISGYSSRCYFEVIYVQGARFLDKLRRDYGEAKFRRAIRNYTRDNRNGIGSNARLLEAFRAEMGNGVLPRFRNRFPRLY